MAELSEYRRITIIGDSGVGKSTLARELERLTGLPVIKYDALWADFPLRVLALRKGMKAARKVVRGARYGAFRHQLRKQALCYGGTVRRRRPNARKRNALLADPAYAHVHQLAFGHPSDTREWLRTAVRAPMAAAATPTIHT